MEEFENIKMPCSLVEEKLITIKNYLMKELDFDEGNAAVIALRLKLRKGTIIRYDLSRHQSKRELGPTTILDFMKKHFITEDDIPELRRNFPTMYRLCGEEDLMGQRRELEDTDVTTEI